MLACFWWPSEAVLGWMPASRSLGETAGWPRKSYGPRLLLLDGPSLGLSPARPGFCDDPRHPRVLFLMVEQNAVAALAISEFAIVMELRRKPLETGNARP